MPADGSPDAREDGRVSHRPRVLMLIPSVVRRDIEDAVAADRHPTMDYHALQSRLGADIADYATVRQSRHPMVRAAARVSPDAALAIHARLASRNYDAIYSNGENVSIPLAAMTGSRRPGHVLIGHHLSTPKKRQLLRRLHGRMDRILVYSSVQLRHARDVLGIPEAKLRLIPFHADDAFFRPLDRPVRRQICSAGLEWRDYPTLIEAVRDLDVEVKLAAASPWSKHANETEGRVLPPNVSARRYEYSELRELYAESAVVAVPLYENDFQAGVTTILEAMAMGRPVIATRTTGQIDVIEEGVNGLYVPPGDARAWRAALHRLLADECLARKLGDGGRRTVVERMSLRHWVDRVASCVEEVAGVSR